MEKYSRDHLVIPEQIDPLQHCYVCPTDEGSVCFSIHINGQFFMVNADSLQDARNTLFSHLQKHIPQFIGSFFWTIEEAQRPKIFAKVTKVCDYDQKVIFAGNVDVQDIVSLHWYSLNSVQRGYGEVPKVASPLIC